MKCSAAHRGLSGAATKLETGNYLFYLHRLLSKTAPREERELFAIETTGPDG